jgi:hypothetical protein
LALGLGQGLVEGGEGGELVWGEVTLAGGVFGGGADRGKSH